MKKALIILILISLVLVPVFSLDVDPTRLVVMNGSVSNIENFKMKLEAALDGRVFVASGIRAGIDLTKNGTVIFRIIDFSEVNLKDGAILEVSVRDSSFTNTENEDAVIETEIVNHADVENVVDNIISTWVSNNKAWQITYPSSAYVSREDNGVVIGTFAISWEGNASLGAGTYTDTVELIYSAK